MLSNGSPFLLCWTEQFGCLASVPIAIESNGNTRLSINQSSPIVVNNVISCCLSTEYPHDMLAGDMLMAFLCVTIFPLVKMDPVDGFPLGNAIFGLQRQMIGVAQFRHLWFWRCAHEDACLASLERANMCCLSSRWRPRKFVRGNFSPKIQIRWHSERMCSAAAVCVDSSNESIDISFQLNRIVDHAAA